MNKAIAVFLWILPQIVSAAYTNYNSILIGDRAAGMGGAYTALSGDPAACSFYNPATLARMEGSSLSAAVNVYNKYETRFGVNDDFQSAPLRVNQGSFVPIPASSGSVHTFRNFAFGLSIVIPDSETYNGEVHSNGSNLTLLDFKDQSLWVGGTLALNLNEANSIGFTAYYTSRTYSRSVTDRVVNAFTSILNENKTLTSNSLLYLIGFSHQFNPHWKLGLSHRFASLPVAGKGTYFRSLVSTQPATSELNEINLITHTKIPTKTALGIAYERSRNFTVAFDLNYYSSEIYTDMQNSLGGDLIIHKPTWNVSLGGEYFTQDWLALRAGLYTNLSSAPTLPTNPLQRQPDHIDMFGFSANAAIYTSSQSSITLGGYYTGGRGHSAQLIEGQIQKITKSHQTFTLLVGTTFRF